MLLLDAARKPSGATQARPAGQDHLLARAPRLREFGDRLVSAIVKALQTMAGPTTAVEGMLAGFASDRAHDFIATLRPDAACGAISLKDVGCTILATLDATMVHAIVELLCGGNGVEPPSVEPRLITPIDQQFAQILFTLAASAIQKEWSELGFGQARAAKIEGPLAPDVFGARVDDIGIMNVTIGIFGLHGSLRLALPSIALERFASDVPGETTKPLSSDPTWTRKLQQQIGRAPVVLAAYLDAMDVALGSLAGLKVGQVLPLPSEARSRASLVADGRVLYRGELGQDDNRYSLRVEEIICDPTNPSHAITRRAPSFEASRV